MELPYQENFQIANPISILHSYLSQPDQDPDWIRWIQLNLAVTPQALLSERLQELISLEENTQTRKSIIKWFIDLDSRSGLYPPVDPFTLETCVRFVLSDFQLDPNFALATLITERESSSFFREVLHRNTDLISAAWEEQQRQEAAALQRHRDYLESHRLLERIHLLKNRRISLLDEIIRVKRLRGPPR